MKKLFCIFIIFLYGVFGLYSKTFKERTNQISQQEMQSVIEFLGHDLLEGRAPGTRGGNLAELYINSLFKWLDLQPGFQDQYLQPFKLKGFTVQGMKISINDKPLNFIEDIVGTWVGERTDFQVESEVVFVGFGITTDLWSWDDYKNVDVKNKCVLTRVNDPGMINDKIFEGKTLTYFGRWTYHIEEAKRRGASAILLIHTDESAGYDWNVVKNSWTGEELYLESDIKGNLKFRGWIKENSLEKILKTKNINLDELYKKSEKKNFQPIPLGFSFKVAGKSQTREVLNHNIIAKIPGKSDKKIVISAHIDHLGKIEGKSGDNILNGTIDNGSAVAAMMVTAKILKEFQTELFYSIEVLACQAEESGLLGSKYYVQTHPDRENIIANINFESTPVWGKTSDFMAIGGRFSTLEDMLKLILKDQGLTYTYFSMVNQGFFYRSDQFSFARYNIPAIWISAGENDDSGNKKYSEFWGKYYHTVKDEYNPTWSLEGMKQTIQMTLLLIHHMNQSKALPKWKGKLTFPIEK